MDLVEERLDKLCELVSGLVERQIVMARELRHLRERLVPPQIRTVKKKCIPLGPKDKVFRFDTQKKALVPLDRSSANQSQ